ncbi:NAD(P)-dependent alcohol dehydrogenase [Arthrobacter sp. ZGTC412]|uniref:NAD(P)-dependent alcohol dehydrogenase n=1 Tax=Arthrobacter sp. ZGTC412 TaxID=2058900 RepID=UPI000CE4F9C8|nr:NAD(P)-dependent alcohol dehydrogenase [Arthrobacter sp. ZGTC412]
MTFTTTAALVEEAGGQFNIEQVELDDIRQDEVLVRMVAAGLCHTDLSVRAGHTGYAFPGILGHEGAGVVEKVGSNVTRVRPGDHVALTFTSCGTCPHCRGGHPAYCSTWVPANLFNNGLRADGTAPVSRGSSPVTARFFGQSSFSAHAVVDERSVVPLGDDLPLHLMAPLGCGVQTGAGTVLNILRPTAGQSIAVFGTGAVGLAAIMAARLTSAGSIIAVDRVQSRLDLALELGATHAINSETADLAGELAAITNGRGLDHAVDTAAHPALTRIITDNLATFGTCAVVGAPPPGTELSVDMSALLVGKKILGVTEGDSEPLTFIPALADLYRRGALPLDRIVKTYKFSEINQAAEDAKNGSVIKPVLLFD